MLACCLGSGVTSAAPPLPPPSCTLMRPSRMESASTGPASLSHALQTFVLSPSLPHLPTPCMESANACGSRNRLPRVLFFSLPFPPPPSPPSLPSPLLAWNPRRPAEVGTASRAHSLCTPFPFPLTPSSHPPHLAWNPRRPVAVGTACRVRRCPPRCECASPR